MVFEDAWGVGEEAAVPEIGAAAFEDVDGLGVGVGATKVEAERAGGFVFAVNDDEVGGIEFGRDGGGELLRGEDGGEDLQAEMRGDEEGKGCCDKPEVGGVGFVVEAEKPVGEGSGEARDGGDEEGVAERGHGAGVEVEEVAEGESVVAGVLVEQRGEVGVGRRWRRVEGEIGSDECCEGADDEDEDGDPLAGAGERVWDGEGFGFGGFVVEPGGDEKD